MHCKTHKNYRAISLPAPEGMRICRKCLTAHPEDLFYDGSDWCKGCRAEYRLANRDRSAAWRRENVDRLIAYSRRWREENPEYHRAYYVENKDQYYAHRRTRLAREAAATVVPFTNLQLQQRLSMFGGRCWICGDPGTHVDHVKPLARGGPHMLANFRPACSRCNTRKSCTWPLTAADLDRIRAA